MLPEGLDRFLGRWKKQSSDAYVRTTTERVSKMQAAVAEQVRSRTPESVIFKEEDIWDRFREYAQGRSFDQDIIDKQIQALTSRPNPKPPAKVADFENQADGRAVRPRGLRGHVQVGTQAAGSCEAVDGSCGEAVGRSEDSKDAVFTQAQEALSALSEHKDCLKELYFVSIRQRSKFRRLHLLGSGRCPSYPGVNVRDFEILGEILPAASQYHAACRRCFPQNPTHSEEPSESGSSSDSDSE